MALVKCKECGTQVSTKATACPSCGAPVKKRSSKGAVTLGVLVFIFLAIVFSQGINAPPMTPEQREANEKAKVERKADAAKRDAVKQAKDEAEEEEKTCSSDLSAYVTAQSYVIKRLKAPATAKFPYISDEGVKTQYVGDCTHKIVGYVDSQNGFGALLRNRYYVKIKNNPKDDSWALLEMKFDRQ